MNFDIRISDIIAFLALLISGVSFRKSNTASKEANDLAKGQSEIEIRNMITNAKQHYEAMCTYLLSDTKNEVVRQIVASALENVANAYDEACAKYIDGKVDKERFKKMYSNELRKWVENKNVKDKYVMPHTQYKATVRVYEEWNNLEK